MALHKWIGPDGHVAIVDGAPVALKPGTQVDIPEGSSPELWAAVKSTKAAARQPEEKDDK